MLHEGNILIGTPKESNFKKQIFARQLKGERERITIQNHFG
jgi:hypothetical protein